MKKEITTPATAEKPLKLNYKNTAYIGFAFFSILMLWQLYNNYCPLFLDYLLRKTYPVDSDELLYIIGIIMAGDNLLAIIMLPLFGTISDKTHSKWGKRMPYIVIGMLLSAICFPLIAVMFIQDSLIGVIVMMLIILIIMNIYRNPAVALMPDVTPKPLRSQANGIINFVGYLGAIIGGGLAMFLKVSTNSDPNSNLPAIDGKTNALIAFIIASIFMIIAMIILVTKIKEQKLLKEMESDMKRGEAFSESLEVIEADKPLSKRDKRNFIILLFAVLFWYISFNAVETFNSLFCLRILKNDGIAGTIVIILTVSSILTFLFSVNLPAKIGRKNAVLSGLGLMIFGFAAIIIYLASSDVFTTQTDPHITIWPIYILIAFCGIGWALINANSYPMIVEMASSKNIGRYTGYYYTFSMLAQTITPIAVGLWMSFNEAGLKLLYIYALITIVISAVIFALFKEKRRQIKKVKGGFANLSNEN